jgi:hypothetical protein
MTPPLPEFSRNDFESLLGEHERLIALANDVEFCLHALAGGATEEHLQGLQQSAGTLVSALRNYLFRQDQLVLPVVDALSRQR